MRSLTAGDIPGDGRLVLMTVEELSPEAPMKTADFRDSFALVFKKTGSFVGWGKDGLRLGENPHLIRGLWLIDDSPELNDKWRDTVLSVDHLSLDLIV